MCYYENSTILHFYTRRCTMSCKHHDHHKDGENDGSKPDGSYKKPHDQGVLDWLITTKITTVAFERVATSETASNDATDNAL